MPAQVLIHEKFIAQNLCHLSSVMKCLLFNPGHPNLPTQHKWWLKLKQAHIASTEPMVYITDVPLTPFYQLESSPLLLTTTVYFDFHHFYNSHVIENIGRYMLIMQSGMIMRIH